MSLPTTHQMHLFNRDVLLGFRDRHATVHVLATGERPLTGNLHAARVVGATTFRGRRVVVAINDDNTFWINHEVAPGTLDLNPGGQWRMVASDFGSRFLGAYTTDLELAVVGDRLTAYALVRIGSVGYIYRGVFPS